MSKFFVGGAQFVPLGSGGLLSCVSWAQALRSNFLLVRASFSVRTLRFSPVSALAAAAAVALALAREFSVK